VNWSLVGQLELEEHGGPADAGVFVPVLVRVFALTAAFWYNDKATREAK
jgi:hypothetical protein